MRTRLHPLLAICALVLLAGCEDPARSLAAETLQPVSSPPEPRTDRISALGRLEPEDGLIRIAGPSGEGAVIGRLLVDEGDSVEKDQLLATLDTVAEHGARIESLEAELAYSRRQLARQENLHTERAISDAARDEWETRVRVTHGQLREAKAASDRAHVRSPVAGRVIEVHARGGERVLAEGILELGRTDHMLAIAEVYETDIGRVKLGQNATVTSPVLPDVLTGKVDWINLRVGKQDTLGTDPAARKDARVVEVDIRLGDSSVASRFTNLQVEIEIEP